MPMPPTDGSPAYPKRIVRFLHCSMCVKESQKFRIPPEQYQTIEIGMTPSGLQVWCKRHDLNIAHFDFGPIAIADCAMCRAGIPHVH